MRVILPPYHRKRSAPPQRALPGLTRSVEFRAPADNLLSVVGIGSGLWDRLFPDAEHAAVSTLGDLLAHLRTNHLDMCIQLATLISQRLEGHAEVVDEAYGFKLFDDRDLLGVVDGSENPEFAAAEHAVRIHRRQGVRYLLHRLHQGSWPYRADAAEHVHWQS